MTPIYHITHVANLAGIIADGGLWSDRLRAVRAAGAVRIAHRHLDATEHRLQARGCDRTWLVLLRIAKVMITSDKMANRTRRPRMTAATAATLGILGRYAQFDYRLTLLEVHKLVYFLKEAGESLPRTHFEKGPYGPYADSLRHVLNRLEGHYLSGFGDGSQNHPDASISLLPGTAEEAEAFLCTQPETLSRFERVTSLIEGFETPYGLELLATVHWIATREDPAARSDVAAVTAGVYSWSPRKQKFFKEPHIRVAWQRLKDSEWI